MTRNARCNSLLACCLILVAASAAGAQEKAIQWRTDYHAARKESEIKKLPLLIDFWRPACPPCEKMELYTFRDPRILAALNEKFIPLKVNGTENTELTNFLKIGLFPTIVMATPEGRLVGDPLVGYLDADILNEHMQRLTSSLTPTVTVNRDFENAQKWETAGDYPRAIAALRGILDDGKAGSARKGAQDLLQKIERRADSRLALAKELQDKGQATEALDALTELLRQFPGLAASKTASERISTLVQANSHLKVEQRNRRARELLAQAQEFYKTRDYIPCLDRCELIISNYGDLPEGPQAFALVSEIKNNPEWLQNAADVMTDRLGGIYLALADSYLKRGEVQRAEYYLKRVVQAFPGSRLAESAQIRLSQLQAPTPRTDTERAGP